MERNISKQELLMHWWNAYSEEPYSIDVFGNFVILIQDQLDLI